MLKLPLLAGKLRLGLEYSMLAGLLALGGFAFTLYIQRASLRKDVAALETQATTLAKVNASQRLAITLLESHHKRDGELTTALMQRLDSLGTVDKGIRSLVYNLEKNNATVHDYLGTPVPPELSCLFSNACRDSAGAARDSSAAANVNHPAVRPPAR